MAKKVGICLVGFSLAAGGGFLSGVFIPLPWGMVVGICWGLFVGKVTADIAYG